MTRPFVFLNAAVSADGKIAPSSRARVRLGSARDRRRMDRLRASADAILIGAGTLRAEDPPLQVRSKTLRKRRVEAGLEAELTTIVISRTLNIPFGLRFFRATARRVLVAPKKAPRRRILQARRYAEVLLLGEDRIEPRALLDRLGRQGIRRLLVEGGGEAYALFLQAGLVDELHVTVCPLLIGGRAAPTLFDGQGFDAGTLPRLRLDLCRREGEEVYLRYRKVSSE